MKEFWNKRYSEEEFAYGIAPNEFFKQNIAKFPIGNILLPGEGEGRNAVYAASLGWKVTAFDYSENAKLKAELLAKNNSVNILYNVSSISEFDYPQNHFDAAAVIFLHALEEERSSFHKNLIKSLKPNGIVILEYFSKEQLKMDSGGPQNPDLLYSLDEVFEDFQDFEIYTFKKEIIMLNEGNYHNGKASVIRFVGRKEF